jgi:hypothetical protein
MDKTETMADLLVLLSAHKAVPLEISLDSLSGCDERFPPMLILWTSYRLGGVNVRQLNIVPLSKPGREVI